MLSDAVPAGIQRSTSIQARNPPAVATTPTMNSNSAWVTLHSVAGTPKSHGRNVSGRTPIAICHVMNVSMSKLVVALEILDGDRARSPAEARQHRPRLRREIAVPDPRRDRQHEPAQRPAAIATICARRTRSCSTGHAISSVQNGIVKTSTEARPAPPPATRHRRRAEIDRRLEERRDQHGEPAMRPRCDAPRATSTANSTATASHVRWTLKASGCACSSAAFMQIQLKPQTSVNSASNDVGCAPRLDAQHRHAQAARNGSIAPRNRGRLVVMQHVPGIADRHQSRRREHAQDAAARRRVRRCRPRHPDVRSSQRGISESVAATHSTGASTLRQMATDSSIR